MPSPREAAAPILPQTRYRRPSNAIDPAIDPAIDRRRYTRDRASTFRGGDAVWDACDVTRLRAARLVMPRALYLTTRRHVDLMRMVGTGCMPAVAH